MKTKLFVYSITSLLLFGGCRPDLLDTTPYDKISAGNMWTTENLADLGVKGVYSILRTKVGQGFFEQGNFGGDTQFRESQSITRGTINFGDGIFSDGWKVGFEGVHRANTAIYNLENVTPLSEEKKGRLIAECKFLRARSYYFLNQVFRGVPLYLEPIEISECTRPRETEERIWQAILEDLTACISEPNLPNRYNASDPEYGRITKGAAYALRGKTYLWLRDYVKAEADFRAVGSLGYALFQGSYKDLFIEQNEQSPEMIFSVQNVADIGWGIPIQLRYGSRCSFGGCWNTYVPAPDFVDSYECKDGTPFNWDNFLPGYNSMTPKQRKVFFLRDHLTDAEKEKMASEGADMSKYLDEGNESRIRRCYEERDPRLMASIITPYSTYLGAQSSTEYTYTLRWPYRGSDTAEPFDLRSDTPTKFYYLYRKFVSEGAKGDIINRDNSPIDFPLIRYADVLLNLAEAINEQGFSEEAVSLVNQVRKRAGVALLQTTDASKPTFVSGQDNLRERIRNERRWEFNGEAINYYDEIRWGTWKDSKFFPGSGDKQIWGEVDSEYVWYDYLNCWPIPKTEREKNPALKQNPGWIE